MKICVCGGRFYSNWEKVKDVLDRLKDEDVTIITGDAIGADSLANRWAIENNKYLVRFPISKEDWKLHQRAAGPIRNKRMLDFGFDALIAFPGGNGTANMVKITQKKGIPVLLVKE